MGRRAALSIALLLLLAACESEGPSDSRVPLRVFAASSLTEAFQDLEREFERHDPRVDVQLVFAGSQTLRVQIEQGASADVFASANAEHLYALHDEGLLGAPRTFAWNELAVVVPLESAAGIDTFADLDTTMRLVVGAEHVPIGAYTRQMLERAEVRFGQGFADRIRGAIVSEEINVRLVRTKVAMGEADAAVVYRTDVPGAAGLREVEIPPEVNVRASYPIATVAGAEHPAEATAFADWLLSESGRAVLERNFFITDEL